MYQNGQYLLRNVTWGKTIMDITVVVIKHVKLVSWRSCTCIIFIDMLAISHISEPKPLMASVCPSNSAFITMATRHR